LAGNLWKQPSTQGENKQFVPIKMEIDLQGSVYDPGIIEEFVIRSSGNCFGWCDLIDQPATDFIIPMIPVTQDELQRALLKTPTVNVLRSPIKL